MNKPFVTRHAVPLSFGLDYVLGCGGILLVALAVVWPAFMPAFVASVVATLVILYLVLAKPPLGCVSIKSATIV